jgi:hypothetical protein
MVIFDHGPWLMIACGELQRDAVGSSTGATNHTGMSRDRAASLGPAVFHLSVRSFIDLVTASRTHEKNKADMSDGYGGTSEHPILNAGPAS